MVQPLEICVPDIGDFEDVEVVELLVAKGESVDFDDPLVSIESDKATMEIPSSASGIVAEIRVAVGDRVSEGSVLVVLDQAEHREEPGDEPAAPAMVKETAEESGAAEVALEESPPARAQSEPVDVSTAEVSGAPSGGLATKLGRKMSACLLYTSDAADEG